MNHRKPLTSLTARSAAIMGILAALAALAAALFVIYVYPAHAQEGSAPAKPTGLYATASHNSVTLTWDDPQNDSITGYVILRRVRVNDTGGDFSELVADTGTAATTYTDDSIKASTTYTYRIKAINQHGVSERSRWYHIDTQPAPAPAPAAPQSKSAYIDAHNARARALEELLAQTDPSSPDGADDEDETKHKEGKGGNSPGSQQNQTSSQRAITSRATVNICDRTREVEAALLAFIRATDPSVTCSTVTDAQLAGVDYLNVLDGYSSPSIVPSDFAGLTTLVELQVAYSQQLTTVPANAFRELRSTTILGYIGLSGNRIKTVHPDAFDGLNFSTVRKQTPGIALNGNVIETLPADVFDDVTGLKSIDLSYNHITGFEDGVFAGLNELERLSLSRNHIKVLPDGLFKGLTALESLHLSFNDLTALEADTFAGLSNLETLDISRCQITSLDTDSFQGLTALETLDLQRNAIPALPTDVFDDLANLSVLRLTLNDISSLNADTLSSLTNLTELHLGGNNLASLPGNSFQNLTNLTTLDLQANDLASVDEGLFTGLADLEALRLDGNQLSALPEDLFDPLDDSLTLLYLHANVLTALDEDIFDGLDGLARLALDDNRLTTLPAKLFEDLDESLGRLWLGDNRFTSLPEALFNGLSGLLILDMTRAGLTTLEPNLFQPLGSNLLLLNLSNNDLASLDENIFDGLDGLWLLYLHGNDLTSLPVDVFDELDALQRLFLHGNDLTTLDADVFDGLDTLARLHLDENDLGSLPAALFEDLDDSLTDLYLRDNGLVVLPTGVFAGLSGLQRLDLSCNVLTALDLDVFNPFGGTLKYLDLGGNSFTTPPTEAAVNAKLTALEALYLTGGPPCLPAYDVGLSALSLSTGTLSPAFAPPGLSQYQAMVGHDVSELTITPTTSNLDAVVGPSPGGDIVNDTDPNTPGIQATLRPISTSVRWKVTAENRDTSRNTTMDYTVLVIREHPPGSVARLRSLELSGLTLAPEFGSSTYDYEAERPASATQTSVTAIPIDPDAEVAITADGGPAEADGTVDISPDTETVTVKVTAEDGVATQTYTVRLELSIEVSGTRLGVMYLEELTGLPTSSDSDSYVRGNRSVNGLWSDGTTLWVADGHSNQARFRKLDCPTNAATSSDGCGVELGPDVPTGSQLTEDGKKIHHDTVKALTAYDLGGGYRIPSRDLPNTSTYAYEDSGIGANPGGGGARDGLVKPDGVWSDGDVVWVSDVSRVVKAYRVSSFAEKSGPEAVAKLLPDRSLTMPVRSVPRGIWSDGTTIWVVDAFRDERAGVNHRPKLVAFDLASGDRVSSRDITGLNGTPKGVWSDGVTLWVSTSVRSGPDNDKVGRDKVLAYEFSPEGGEAVRDEDRDLRLRNHSHATGLWSDGERMWVGDGGPAVHVYCLDRAASCHGAQKRSTDATIALPYPSGNFDLSSDNANPGATWSDDTTLWALDATDKKIYTYALSDGTADTTSLSLATDNADPAGMWSDGTTIWVSDSADYKLYAYTMDPWERDGGSDFSLTGLNAAARSLGGVWSNGAGTIWVAHRLIDGPGRATAFNTGDGSLDNDRTFDLSALNSNPAGMWSDGRTMWVLDTGADKVFAYDLDTGQSLPHRDVDALIARFEQISDTTPTSVVGIGSPTGFHVGESGSGGPSRWPRSLPPECFETHAKTDADGNIVEPDPPIAPMPPCDRPYGRMMWVVDGQNNKVHAIRLHPALFDAPAAESENAGSDNRSAPPPPDNVRAVTQKSGAVALTWESPDGATVTGYRIDRRRAGEGLRDNHVLVEDTGSVHTGYTDKSAEEGVDYEYRVSSRNEDGPGEVSDWVRAVPEEEPVFGDGPPGAPRNLTAAAGDQEITLSWEPPDDNGAAPATRYRIEWRMDGKDYKKGHWGTSGSTTYTKTDLANGVKYVFRVKAENGSGNSYGPYGPASDEVSATPTSGSAVDLGTPVLSNTKTLHHGMVRLDWEDIEDAGWYVVQYYHVKSGEWLDLPAAGVDIAFHGSSAVASNLHGLSWLRVRAMSCAGESEWSQIEQLFGTNASDWEGVPVPDVAEGDQIDPCPVILGTPVLSNTKTLHHGMVQLDWEDIEDAGWYVVQHYHVKSGEWLDLPAAGVDIAFHGSSAVVSDLHGLSWLRVRAVSCAGESEWSQIEELYGTNASDWEDVPVPEVAEGDEIEPCDEDVDTSDNSPATGLPTISGTAQVGETLTANTSGVADADGLSNVQYEYQWLADDSDISGATNTTYTLVAADEGKAVKVRVSFTDDAGNEESLTSAATGAVAAAPTTNSPATGAPAISGTAQVGETLTADTPGIADEDGLTNATYSFQWLAGDSEIAGATNADYTLAEADEGKVIKVRVSFADDAGNAETLTSPATDAVAAVPNPNSPATGAPAISGTAQVGETLTANTSGIADSDGLGNVQYEHQWLADDSGISGAANATYTLVAADEGKVIKVRVTFTDDEGNDESLTSAATDAVAARPNSLATGAPTISGTVQVGKTLTADTSGLADSDGLTNATFSYQWLADDTEIAGATSLIYTLADVDEGKAIKVEASFTDDEGNDESLTSAATAAVAAAEPSEPPDKPTGLFATATHDQVVLTWDDPGDDSITGYVILRRVRENDTGGEFSVLVPDTGSAATTYTDDTVVAETTYTYRIKAINEHGVSKRSRWFHIDTPAAP